MQFQLAGFLGDFFEALHKGRYGPERRLSPLLLDDETLGFFVSWHIAGHADAQQLVLGGILGLFPLFGEGRTLGRIIHLDVKGGSVLGILQYSAAT